MRLSDKNHEEANWLYFKKNTSRKWFYKWKKRRTNYLKKCNVGA